MRIRLTEAQLHRVIKESINHVISKRRYIHESEEDGYDETDGSNDGDYDDKQMALASFLECDPSKIEEDKYQNTIYYYGNAEYLVYDNYDEARNDAISQCIDLLEDCGIESVNWNYIGRLSDYVDENWFREALEESYENNEEDGEEEHEIDDPVQEFIDEFGEREFNDVVKEHNLLDYQKAAEAIVDADGIANTLSSYDGNENEVTYNGNDYYIFRAN